MKIRYLCCKSNPKSDAIVCLRESVIAFKNNRKIEDGEQFYIVFKDGKDCKICGRGKVCGMTNSKSFMSPEQYRTFYALKDVEGCIPFSINDISKERLGNYWGMNLQSSCAITNDEYIREIEKRFVKIEVEEAIQIIEAG